MSWETPLFIDDDELHRRVAPHLARERFDAAIRVYEFRGFPKIDAIFGGRYWAAVVRWFNVENGLTPEGRRPPEEHLERPIARPQRRPGQVYFMKVGDHVKIGFTTDWRSRLPAIQTSSPRHVHVLAVIKGGHDVEGAMHARFAHLRGSGEWFEAAPELLDFIRDLPAEERIR